MHFLRNQQLPKRLSKKAVFLSRLLKRIRFWNKFLTMRQILRIKISKKKSNNSQFYTTRPFFYRKPYSVLDFETSILPHIRFWTEILTTQQTFTWNWFQNIKLSRSICFQKIYLLCQFTLLKCQIWFFPTFLEKIFLRAMFLGKNILWIENFEKYQIFIQFYTTPQTFKQNNYFLSKCKLTIHIPSKLESRFLPRIRFRWKNCFWKIKFCWRSCSQRITYLVNLHHKNVKVGFFVLSWRSCSRKSCFFSF